MTTHKLVGIDGEHGVLHDLGGDGPPLLLTHGNGLNAGMWAAVVPHIKNRFHCYGLDFRGHGASRTDAVNLDTSRELLDAEVLAAARALGAPGLLAAGHSLGAGTLIRVERDNPGTLARLWAFEPVLVPTTFDRPDGPSPIAEMARKRRNVFDSVDAAYERFVSKAPYNQCEPAAVRAYVDLGTIPQADGTARLTCTGDIEASIYESGESMDFSTFAPMTCPTVISYGDVLNPANDLPPAMAPLIAEAMPHATLECLAGVTHFGPMENGELVAEAISKHLTDDSL